VRAEFVTDALQAKAWDAAMKIQQT
jgi:hypothetical protein